MASLCTRSSTISASSAMSHKPLYELLAPCSLAASRTLRMSIIAPPHDCFHASARFANRGLLRFGQLSWLKHEIWILVARPACMLAFLLSHAWSHTWHPLIPRGFHAFHAYVPLFSRRCAAILSVCMVRAWFAHGSRMVRRAAIFSVFSWFPWFG